MRWKWPCITRSEGSRNRNQPTDFAEEADRVPWCSVVTRPGRTFRGPADQILRAKSVRAHAAQFGLLWPISAYKQMRESTGGQGFFREANRRLLQTREARDVRPSPRILASLRG